MRNFPIGHPIIFPTDLYYEFENSILFAPKRVRATSETEEDYVLGQMYWDRAWNNYRTFVSQWNLDESHWIVAPVVDVARNHSCIFVLGNYKMS